MCPDKVSNSELVTKTDDVLYDFADRSPFDVTPPEITFYPPSCFELVTFVITDNNSGETLDFFTVMGN